MKLHQFFPLTLTVAILAIAPHATAAEPKADAKKARPRSDYDDSILQNMDHGPFYSGVFNGRDISLKGISVTGSVKVAPNRVLRIVGPAFDVLAQVISCRSSGRQYTLHARLLTAIFSGTSGVFVSVRT